MPDFERVVDDLRYHLADSDEEKAFIRGYVAGKNYARREVLVMVLLSVVIGFLFLMSGFGVNKFIIGGCILLLLAVLVWMSSRILPPYNYKK